MRVRTVCEECLGKVDNDFQCRLGCHSEGIANCLSPNHAVKDLWQEGHTYKTKMLSDLS